MKKAFTLAEVLITLGVIGVVAALTISVLIQNYKNNVVETRLKKFYTLMNQAILQSINDNGPLTSWDYWGADKRGELPAATSGYTAMQNYILPYLKVIEIKDIKNRKLYILEDGSSFSSLHHENREIAFYPKNGEDCMKRSEDQIYGVCGFLFNFFPDPSSKFVPGDWKYLANKGMEPFLYYWNGNEKTLNESTKYGCKNGSAAGYPNNIKGAYCTAMIQRNGWKIPSNYPRKISY